MLMLDQLTKIQPTLVWTSKPLEIIHTTRLPVCLFGIGNPHMLVVCFAKPPKVPKG
jgi:hypothetical protein